MVEIGYKLSTEEHGAPALVKNARLAKEAGFDFVNISDHYHPWNRKGGRSPFAWTVLGGIAAVTDRVKVSTGVTCPTINTLPPGDRGPDGRDGRDPDGGAVLARDRLGREPERAHPRRPLSAGHGPDRDDEGGDRRDPDPLEGRGHGLLRDLLHRREGPALFAPRDTAADHRLGHGADRGEGGGGVGRPADPRPLRSSGGARGHGRVQGRRRHGQALRRRDLVLLPRGRGEGEGDRVRLVADGREQG